MERQAERIAKLLSRTVYSSMREEQRIKYNLNVLVTFVQNEVVRARLVLFKFGPIEVPQIRLVVVGSGDKDILRYFITIDKISSCRWYGAMESGTTS